MPIMTVLRRSVFSVLDWKSSPPARGGWTTARRDQEGCGSLMDIFAWKALGSAVKA
jgi:hypothetical protein